MLTGAEMQLGRGETIADTARVLSRYVDAIMIRMLDHDDLLELAQYATVPVINGLTKLSHPCQVLADVMTFEEKNGPISGRQVAWTGDYNNVLASWVHAAARFGSNSRRNAAGTAPRERIDWARRPGATSCSATIPKRRSPARTAVISDTWVSMGDEDDDRRHNLLTPYQVNDD